MATTSADYNFRELEPHWQAAWEAAALSRAASEPGDEAQTAALFEESLEKVRSPDVLQLWDVVRGSQNTSSTSTASRLWTSDYNTDNAAPLPLPPPLSAQCARYPYPCLLALMSRRRPHQHHPAPCE